MALALGRHLGLRERRVTARDPSLVVEIGAQQLFPPYSHQKLQLAIIACKEIQSMDCIKLQEGPCPLLKVPS